MVTFTLSGFTTQKREGLVLEGSFVAEVNANLISATCPRRSAATAFGSRGRKTSR